MSIKKYNVYRGLQRPLVFKGFKGKYIYWAAGTILGALIGAGIAHALLGNVATILVFGGTLGGGLYYTAQNQKRGLHKKNRNKGVFIIAPTTKSKTRLKNAKTKIRVTIYRH